jgi:hypothetical protein
MPCRGAFDACYQLTLRIMQSDPYALECLPSHVASALQLGKKNELFLRGHKLVQVGVSGGAGGQGGRGACALCPLCAADKGHACHHRWLRAVACGMDDALPPVLCVSSAPPAHARVA